MSIRIVQAHLSDLETLIEWRMEVLAEVFGELDASQASQLKTENTRYFCKALKDKSHIAAFAQIDDVIVGCGGVCLYQEMPSPDNPSGKCAYLMNIYTKADHRGLGIGTTLVEWLIAAAKGTGASKIYLETTEVGRALYEKLGFEYMKDYMILHHD